MEQEAYVIDAYKEKDGTGVLGRMLDMMESKNFSVGSIAMNGDSVVLAGATDRFTDVIPAHGPVIIQRQKFSGWGNDLNDIKSYIEELNSESKVNSGLFANHWSQNLVNVWAKSDDLKSVLDGATLKKAFTGGLGTNFKTISKLIVTHAIRKKTREAFYVRLGGFDAHTGAKSNLDQKLPEVNRALTSFYLEMKEQDLLDSVTVLVGSEFGRTLSQNSGGGTDHAWGGNYFMFGGQVNGSRILGAFPETFAENDPTNIGRGRLIPTTSWDALWHGISQWFGVTEDEKLDYVLPNRNNFACQLFTDKDLYLGGNNSISGCGGNEVQFDIKLFLKEPRYLTGIEQNRICAAAIVSATNLTGSAAKCLIVDQKIIVSYERRLLNHEMDVVSTSFEKYVGDARRLGGLGNITSVSVVATTKVTYGETSNNSTLSLNPIEMQNVLQRDITAKIEDGIVENATKVDVEAKTSAPTSEPSSMPSGSPSKSHMPSKSDLPTTEPSYNPSKSYVPTVSGGSPVKEPKSSQGRDWYIAPIPNGTSVIFKDGEDSEITLMYEKTPNRTAKVSIWMDDCYNTPNPSNVIVAKMNETVREGQLNELKVLLDVNTTSIQNSTVWTSMNDAYGFIQFCVVTELLLDETNTSVSFHENVLNITVDTRVDFEMNGISTIRKNGTMKETNAFVNNTLEACLCEKTTGACVKKMILTQNSLFDLCIKPLSPEVVVEKIETLTFSQNSVPKYVPIENGIPNSLTFPSSHATYMVVSTRAISKFFEEQVPEPIEGSGQVILSFASTSSNSRYLRRLIEDGDEIERKEQFYFEIELEPATTAFDYGTVLNTGGNEIDHAGQSVASILAFIVTMSFCLVSTAVILYVRISQK